MGSRQAEGIPPQERDRGRPVNHISRPAQERAERPVGQAQEEEQVHPLGESVSQRALAVRLEVGEGAERVAGRLHRRPLEVRRGREDVRELDRLNLLTEPGKTQSMAKMPMGCSGGAMNPHAR